MVSPQQLLQIQSVARAHARLCSVNADTGRVRRSDEGYAREEPVAELGSAFLCADLGLTPEVREDHAAYIATWITVLKDDKRAIFSAAAHAQRAADYLHSR
jgi:antirestriction protein ArdC